MSRFAALCLAALLALSGASAFGQSNREERERCRGLSGRQLQQCQDDRNRNDRDQRRDNDGQRGRDQSPNRQPQAPAAPPNTPSRASPGAVSSPGPSVANGRVTLSWSAVPGAAWYQIGVRDVSGGEVIANRRVDGASLTVEVRGGRTFRWNVAACNAAGCSDFSPLVYFNTNERPDNDRLTRNNDPRSGGDNPRQPNNPNNPTLGRASAPNTPARLSPGAASGPGQNVDHGRVTLNWAATAGADSYQLTVRDGSDVVVNRRVQDNNAQVELQRGRTYRWHVAACNEAGCSDAAAPMFLNTERSGANGFGLPQTGIGGTNTAGTTPMTIAGDDRGRIAREGLSGLDLPNAQRMDRLAERRRWGAACVDQSDEVRDAAREIELLAVAGALGPDALDAAGLISEVEAFLDRSEDIENGRWYPATLSVINSGLSLFVSVSTRGALDVPITIAEAITAIATAYIDGYANACGGAFDHAPPPSGATLSITSFAASIEYSSTTHVRRLDFAGAGFDGLTEIRFARTGPVSDQMTWRPSDREWNTRLHIEPNGRSGYARPVVTQPGDPPGRYEWQVTLVAGQRTVTRGFVVDTQPETPTPTNVVTPNNPTPGVNTHPGPLANSTAVRLSWDRVPGATEYDLGVRDLTTNDLVVDRRVSGTSYTANLQPGRRYAWNVAACNSSGCSSFSGRLYFGTP